MKILIYRYGSICEPDIIAGFEEMGHQVTQITAEITNKNLVFSDIVMLVNQSLQNSPQDFVFTVNFFPMVSEVCNIYKIPYLCWTVDSPVMELFTKSISNSCNRIFLFDQEQYREIAPHNPGHVFHFPLAVNVKHKQQVIQNASASQRRCFSSDISFVGSLYTEKCPYDKLPNKPNYLNGYLNGLMESQLKVYGYYFIEEALPDHIIQEFKKQLPGFYQSPLDNFLTDRITTAQLYIGNKITALERVRTMKELCDYFPVTIYTGSDTKEIPRLHNGGLVKSLTEMPIVFHESKINLNMTSKAIRSGIPLRVFDILACEGFMLSNYQNELMQFLEPGIDFDYYTSTEELIEKINYYLQHENQRKEIARNGYEKVLKEFNYPKRLSEMLDLAFSVS